MNNFSQEEISKIKKAYPKGTRIRLEEMKDDPFPVESGTTGTVNHVDDMGTIHVSWDNGHGLGLVPNVDIFNVTETPKLFYGYAENERVEIRNTHEMAKFIMEYGVEEDVLITDEFGGDFVTTFGIYINKIADMDYRELLLKELIPMQQALAQEQLA